MPRTIDDLLPLPGVACKTANTILGTAYDIASGIVVDTHAFRVATTRYKPSRGKTPEEAEQDLLKIVLRRRWIRFNYYLTLFDQELCFA